MKWPENYINKIIQGDCLSVLKEMPGDKIDMIMTSPPYWGLRDYGVKGQLGLEPTFYEFLDKILVIMAELKRVLKPAGSFYLNMGDTYGSGPTGSVGQTGKERQRSREASAIARAHRDLTQIIPKCLVGAPWRLALRMIDEQGWILRNEIIWHKPNCMPCSVKDRLANTHEKIYHFVKSQKYYYDLDVIRVPLTGESQPFNYRVREAKKGHDGIVGVKSTPDEMARHDIKGTRVLNQRPHGISRKGHSVYYGKDGELLVNSIGKNPGDCWDIPPQPFPEAHFATFPEKLCEKPILSSCPKEICKKCGKARERISKSHYENDTTASGRPARGNDIKGRKKEGAMNFASGERTRLIVETLGWTDCGCNAGWESGIVLDPFAGAGTTCLVAQKLSNKYIGIEINPDYIKIAKKRLAQEMIF